MQFRSFYRSIHALTGKKTVPAQQKGQFLKVLLPAQSVCHAV